MIVEQDIAEAADLPHIELPDECLAALARLLVDLSERENETPNP